MISPVAVADLHLPVVRGATTPDPEENPMSETLMVPDATEAALALDDATIRELFRLGFVAYLDADQIRGALADRAFLADSQPQHLDGEETYRLTWEVRIVSAACDVRPSEIDSTDGSLDDVRALLAERDDEDRRALARALGVPAEAEYDSISEHLARYREQRARELALSAAEPPAEAGSGNGAGEAREAVSGRPGASHGPSEGGGSAR